jgi:hypothetical protein
MIACTGCGGTVEPFLIPGLVSAAAMVWGILRCLWTRNHRNVETEEKEKIDER